MSQELNHSPAYVTSKVLIALNLGTAPPGGTTIPSNNAWPIYATNEPDKPDNVITVFNSPDSMDDGRSMLDGTLYTHFGIQVRVRSIRPDTCWLRADAIRKALSEDIYDYTITINSIQYLIHAYTRIKPVYDLGKDKDTQRNICVVNCTVVLTQSD